MDGVVRHVLERAAAETGTAPRALVSGARDRARAIFVGVQLAWLVVLLVRNGLFSPASR